MGGIEWGPADDNESVAAIRNAIAAGVNWIDTASVYGFGRSERVLRRALAPYVVGEDVYVFTKCGLLWNHSGVIRTDLRPSSIRNECEASLQRLGVERIDLYQVHWPDWATGTPIEESWGTLGELLDEGKVRWIGLSNVDLSLLERCEAVRHVDSLQPPLSLLQRGACSELIPWAQKTGTGVIVYSTLASGLLSGTFDRARLNALPPNDWRREYKAFQEPKFSEALELVNGLGPIVEQLGTEISTLAVAWALSIAGVTGAIVGVRTRNHVRGWMEAADLELDADVLAEIDRVLAWTGAGDDDPPPTGPWPT